LCDRRYIRGKLIGVLLCRLNCRYQHRTHYVARPTRKPLKLDDLIKVGRSRIYAFVKITASNGLVNQNETVVRVDCVPISVECYLLDFKKQCRPVTTTFKKNSECFVIPTAFLTEISP
jgi:hypothetical protein